MFAVHREWYSEHRNDGKSILSPVNETFCCKGENTYIQKSCEMVWNYRIRFGCNGLSLPELKSNRQKIAAAREMIIIIRYDVRYWVGKKKLITNFVNTLILAVEGYEQHLYYWLCTATYYSLYIYKRIL